jgi:TetR/AcrR family transcriptional regulator, regulator of autoinduction and epiphytic fitness
VVPPVSVGLEMPTVKGKKPSRAERTRENRGRMIGAARTLFTERGYPSTTMEQIAAEAGVAVQTVYYTFGTKARLLCEAVEVTAAGEPDPEPVVRRPWMVEAMSSPSAQRALALAVEHGTDIYERVAPLRPALAAAAAADPYVEEYASDIATTRRSGMGRLVGRLAELGSLRPGLDQQRATDLLFVLDSHETFLGLTRQAGWSVPSYKAWLFTTLAQQLLGVEPERSAVEGLTFSDLSS